MEANDTIRSRTEVLAYLQSLGLIFDLERCHRDISYVNGILENALKQKSLWVVRRDTEVREYCVTFTTQVIDGFGKRQYPEFSAMFQRILTMPGVMSIEGNYELTKQKALHAHVIIKMGSGRYLDLTKVRRFNGGEFIKSDLIKSEKHRSACLRYLEKDIDCPDTLKYLEKYKVYTTLISLTKS